MKHFYCTLLAVLFSALPVLSENSPTWLADLENRNKDLIDSIVAYHPSDSAPEYTTLIIYFHQPLDHAKPQGAQFPMRALFTYDNRKNPVNAVNHVYFTGYHIDPYFLAAPDSMYKETWDDSAAEISHRYRGNYIQLEHRYFDYSAPYQCWTLLDYCTAEEAAEDFHAIIEAFKKVFTGKWVISGVSKGGVTTAIQHLFHPEDADIFVPYAAPFYDSDRDSLTLHYWYNNGWNKEYRDLFANIRRQALSNKDRIYPIFEKMMAGNNYSRPHLDTIFGHYISSVAQFGYKEHTYGDTASIRKQLALNDSIVQACHTQYGDTVCAYWMAASEISLAKFQPWLDTLRAYPDQKQGPRHVVRPKGFVPFGVTEDDWVTDDGSVSSAAYHYQAQCELGYYDCRFEEIVGDEQVGAAWNEYWREHYTCLLKFLNPFFASRVFNPDLYNRVTAATRNAEKPVIFIYGTDDSWTGGAMKDEFINGTASRKFILPRQNHLVRYTANTDPQQCAQIKRLLDDVLGEPQGIQTVSPLSETKTQKRLVNGQLLIIRNNEQYDITGKKL